MGFYPFQSQRQKVMSIYINGDGDFTSVQAAIDSVPEGNSQWVIIHIRKGVYTEKVHIPKNKPYIFLRGIGRGRSAIVESPNFIAFGVSFKNEAPTGVAYTSHSQLVAAFVAADKVAFYHCAFYSTHNTLFDFKGRHYYDNCYIQGSIDFIFGRGRSVFHSCEIFVISDKRVTIHGSITAQNRESANENSGFVFVKTVVPKGWTNWSYDGTTEFSNKERMYHVEFKTFKCHGPGAESQQRAPWSKELTEKEAAPFLSIDYINGEEWLPVWP
ncbi:hypothetical protein I3760_02G075100 [Carya illinoinensis]|nr:hypothetical protein I3760_02G075100 [Carya illinoinensis]